jgi:hypothetical protein
MQSSPSTRRVRHDRVLREHEHHAAQQL